MDSLFTEKRDQGLGNSDQDLLELMLWTPDPRSPIPDP